MTCKRSKLSLSKLLRLLKKLLERNPNAKQKELLEVLGIDCSYVSKLKRELKMWIVIRL